MSIKSDRWIQQMASRHGMIEPFEAEQVRFNDTGDKLISYGTSSYGYDVRCAREFKVFTNVHSAIVDPKTLTLIVLLTLWAMNVSFLPIHLPWLVPWNIFEFLVMY